MARRLGPPICQKDQVKTHRMSTIKKPVQALDGNHQRLLFRPLPSIAILETRVRVSGPKDGIRPRRYELPRFLQSWKFNRIGPDRRRAPGTFSLGRRRRGRTLSNQGVGRAGELSSHPWLKELPHPGLCAVHQDAGVHRHLRVPRPTHRRDRLETEARDHGQRPAVLL